MKENRKIVLMKEELGGVCSIQTKNIQKFNNLTKPKGIRKCVIKLKLRFEDYKNCLEVNQLEK